MSSYYILIADDDPKYCCIEDVPEPLLAKEWRITEGRRMDDRYPDDVQFRMGSHYPGLVVPDVICNLCDYWMISGRLKDVIESEVPSNVEYLPFTLVNHKGRTVDGSFFIANVTDVIDCVDLQRTEYVESRLEPGTFMWLKKLEIDESRLTGTEHVFRIAQMPHLIIVSARCREVFAEHEVTGGRYIATGEPCMLQ